MMSKGKGTTLLHLGSVENLGLGEETPEADFLLGVEKPRAVVSATTATGCFTENLTRARPRKHSRGRGLKKRTKVPSVRSVSS